MGFNEVPFWEWLISNLKGSSLCHYPIIRRMSPRPRKRKKKLRFFLFSNSGSYGIFGPIHRKRVMALQSYIRVCLSSGRRRTHAPAVWNKPRYRRFVCPRQRDYHLAPLRMLEDQKDRWCWTLVELSGFKTAISNGARAMPIYTSSRGWECLC